MENSIKSVHAGFWKRTFAFIIDILSVGLISLILSFLLKDILLTLGENLWYIGFIILGLYFVILNSSIGKGQTLGKKILKIRVIHEKEKFLTILQSFFRYFILSLFIFSSGINATLTSHFGVFQIIPTIFNILTTFIIFGVIGLLIFNKNKRGLHDYLVKTVVINSKNTNDINIPYIDNLNEAFSNHKIAFIITIILFILISTATVIVTKMTETSISGEDFNTMLELKTNIENEFDISNLDIQTQKFNVRWGSEENIYAHQNLVISGYLKYSIYEDENAKTQLYEEINKKVISTHPNISNYKGVVIVFRTGYNLGIANFRKNEHKTFPLKST